MVVEGPVWQDRVKRVSVGVEWIALAIGIVVSIAETDASPLAFIASGLGAVWVVATTSLPINIYTRQFVLDALIVVGIVLTMTAMVLTGGTSSPFVLLAITPSIRAGLFGGLRVGLSAGTLSGLLIVAVALASEESVLSSLALATLFVAIGVTVAQIRRIVLELQDEASRVEAQSSASTLRLKHLEDANQLLGRLAEITSRDEISPIDVGRAALETITGRFPNSAGTAALEGEHGPILVSRYGSIPTPSFDTEIPLLVSERRVGFIRLNTPEPLDDDTVVGLHEAVRPVALAFANALLLQDVTRNAVREERTRLARELHDEFGPSLASLGLSLDMALIQGVDQREINDHLSTLRERVGSLVDEVRYTVTDLRAGTPTSLVTRLESLRSSLPESPTIHIDIDERRPVRPSLADNVYGILGESIRNAVNHSGTASVRITGWADFDRGRVVVADNGTGFDPEAAPSGHFGVIGMKERASDSNIRLDISSSQYGTNVTIEWGEP